MIEVAVVRKSDFTEGRWPNGAGVSWTIASSPTSSAPAKADWYFATALIERPAPFSLLPGVDRVMTLIEGGGFRLRVDGLGEFLVDRPSVPIPFPGDRPTECQVEGKPSTVLNLLFARTLLTAEVSILKDGDCIDVPGHCEVVLLYALAGRAALSWEGQRAEINAGDAALFQPRNGVASRVGIDGHGVRVYRAVLRRVITGPADRA
jgi:hypothetical protein